MYINSVLTKVFLLLPHYCLGRGLIDMAANQLVTDAFAALGMCNTLHFFEAVSSATTNWY